MQDSLCINHLVPRLWEKLMLQYGFYLERPVVRVWVQGVEPPWVGTGPWWMDPEKAIESTWDFSSRLGVEVAGPNPSVHG